MMGQNFQDPPGLAVATLAQKAAWDRGFRIELLPKGPWLGYASTTASGELWIAGMPPSGPFALSVTHAGVGADLAATFAPAAVAGPGVTTILLPNDDALTQAVDRAWKLAMSLPPTPLIAFEAAIAGLSRATEAERLVVQRIGQDKFRDALMLYWSGRCPLTGITDPALLRASHIIPWAECDTDAERLDANNGLLLSSLWDAAFDAHLVSFDDDGRTVASPLLTADAKDALVLAAAPPIANLTPGHRARLAVHRRITLLPSNETLD
jgi:hypothetical protein